MIEVEVGVSLRTGYRRVYADILGTSRAGSGEKTAHEEAQAAPPSQANPRQKSDLLFCHESKMPVDN